MISRNNSLKYFIIFLLIVTAVVAVSICFLIPEEYNINYVLNGGENNLENPSRYVTGDKLTLIPPTKENHVFQGWYVDKEFTIRMDELPSDMLSGDLTLYAKWSLQPLNINSYGTDDMIWNWWYYPQVISHENMLYWSYTASNGQSGIAAYDKDSGETVKTVLKQSLTSDDHNGMAISFMDDGRVMCVYASGHNSDNNLHVRISNTPYNIDRFDTEIVLESAGKTCYSQLLTYNNHYYVFYRVDNKDWAYRSSFDGVYWTEETILVTSTMQYYCKFVPTTIDGLIRICMYSNPDTTDPNIRMGFFDLETEVLLNSDCLTELGTGNISYDNFDVIIPYQNGLTQRMFDVAISNPEDPLILYATFDLSVDSQNSVYYIYDNNASQMVCYGGTPLWNPKYQLGAAFVSGGDTIVVSRNENGSDIIELYDYSSGVLTLSALIHSEYVDKWFRNARPIVDINGAALLWHRGYYNPETYTDFSTEARIYWL